MATYKEMIDALVLLNVCETAVNWMKEQPDHRTAWERCERADWMLWFAARTGVDRHKLIHAACDCVEMALERIIADDVHRVDAVQAIEIARAWGEGREGGEVLRNAISCAASICAYSAATVISDARTGTDRMARAEALRQMSDLVRSRIPFELVDGKGISFN